MPPPPSALGCRPAAGGAYRYAAIADLRHVPRSSCDQVTML